MARDVSERACSPRPPTKGKNRKADVRHLIDTQILVGWREWLALPKLGVNRIKAKIDTGARTSALHATDIELFKEGELRLVRFTVEPHAGGARDRAKIHCQAPVKDERSVKSSNGVVERRVVIVTPVAVGARRLNIEITLTNRAEMGFEMLFGRTALRAGRFLVHPSRSFLQSQNIR
ncbi:MAG: ATP-dependent zinc protease [Geminicoccaceae bacterium]